MQTVYIETQIILRQLVKQTGYLLMFRKMLHIAYVDEVYRNLESQNLQDAHSGLLSDLCENIIKVNFCSACIIEVSIKN